VDKRTFLKSVFLGSTGLILSASVSKVKASRVQKTWDGVFILPELNYSFHSLEPHMNASLLRQHYQVHHAGYVRQLNSEVRQQGLKGITAYAILSNAAQYNKDTCHLGGGFLNHKLFWKMLRPAVGQQPSEELKRGIESRFGSMDAFRGSFNETALAHHENGWNWLVYSGKGLEIVHTSQNDNPIMNQPAGKITPLLCLDLWDHAFGPDSKAEYVESFWNVVNWDFVSKRYHFAVKKSGS
jgi:superoxide dismutase, Fe-Mn family